MRLMRILSGLALATAMAACGSDSTETTADAKLPDSPTATAATVNFTVDDSINKVYGAGDLQWKGSMMYAAASNSVTKDSTWSGPWAPLYDDGPVSAGGHEPAGSTAGDHKWSISLKVTPPATGTDTYEYGLIDASYVTKFGGDSGWLWVGSNGTFNVKSTDGGNTITATGQALAAFGTNDLQIVIDTKNLATPPVVPDAGSQAWDTSKVSLKSSAWAWGVPTVTVDAQGKATFTLSENIGTGKQLNHTGLLKSGDKPEFVVVFGTKEYKDGSGNCNKQGVTASVKPSGGSFAPVSVSLYDKNGTPAGNGNTYVTVP